MFECKLQRKTFRKRHFVGVKEDREQMLWIDNIRKAKSVHQNEIILFKWLPETGEHFLMSFVLFNKS